MPVPISQMYTVATYVLRQKLAGRERYPLVLMLEPLYRCNLACAGCGKIQYPSQVLRSQLSYEDCMRAVDECPAPVVSLPGGEPLLHPEIDRIVRGLVARKKYIYLCTNALLLEEKLDLFTPSRYLSFSVHLDGDRETHDHAVCREGTYDRAVRAIRAAVSRGFRVTTNTTLFEGADPERTARFFDDVMALGVEGMMVSPGYAYDKAPDQEHFLARERTRGFFRRLLQLPGSRRWRFNQSPLFLEFLAGARRLECTPWGNPTYSVFGWQKPCYLLQDGYADSFAELMQETRFEQYGHGSGNPRCRDCMVHSGFEPSAVEVGFSSWQGFLAMAKAALLGPRLDADARAQGAAVPAAPAVGAVAGGSAPSPSGARDEAAGTASFGRGWSAPATPEALRTAFTYRGDVTLALDDGAEVQGYVVNATDRELRLWRKGSVRPLSIPTATVRRVTLSGRDTAGGPSSRTFPAPRAVSAGAPDL